MSILVFNGAGSSDAVRKLMFETKVLVGEANPSCVENGA